MRPLRKEVRLQQLPGLGFSMFRTTLTRLGAVHALLMVACGPALGTQPAEVQQLSMDGEKLFAEGRAADEAGDLVRAQQYYVAALRAGYPDAEVTPQLVAVCLKAGRVRAALQYAEDSLHRQPKNWSLRFLVGNLQEALGNLVQAESTYRELTELAPNFAGPFLALARVRVQQQVPDWSTIEPLLARFLELNGDSSARQSVEELRRERVRQEPSVAAEHKRPERDAVDWKPIVDKSPAATGPGAGIAAPAQQETQMPPVESRSERFRKER